jgi:hypothetical protein
VVIRQFDPSTLKSGLTSLDSQCRAAFVLACSLRVAGTGKATEPLAEAARLLVEGYSSNRSIDIPTAEHILAELDQSAELDLDDVAASFYALAAVVHEDLESAIWAAQRAFDAADARAQQAMNVSSYSAYEIDRLLKHQEVQRELMNQAFDLKALQEGVRAIPLVIERARSAA